MRSIFLLVLFMWLLQGCTKDETPLPPNECTICATTVSFKTDIIPILKGNCSTAGCHDFDNASGGLTLDSSLAYANLTVPGGGYIDTNDVTNSLLYTTLLPGSATPMPEDLPALPECDINRIKCWIEQGAPDN